MLAIRVAKVFLAASRTWTMSKRTGVLVHMNDGTDTADVSTTGDHAELSHVEPQDFLGLVGSQVHLDGVVHPDGGVGVFNCAPVVGDGERHNTKLSLHAGVASNGGLLA